jgi:VanZ family protein
MDLWLCTEGSESGMIDAMMGDLVKSCFRPRWRWLPLLATVCVLSLTHIPNENMPRALQVRALDKVEHIVAYGLIAGSFLLALQRPVRGALLWAGVMILAVLGALDETTQPLVHRTCDLLDFASDLTGIAIAYGVFGVARWARFRTAASGGQEAT